MIEEAKVNLAYKWFVGVNPEDARLRNHLLGASQVENVLKQLFYFEVEKCKACPLRDGCYKPESKSKTYSIRIIAEHFKEQIEFELSEERIKRRPIIEHKNAKMKRFRRMAIAKYRGLFRMRIQAYLTPFVVNVKRMVRLIEQKQPIL
jgi:hypothetical protein